MKKDIIIEFSRGRDRLLDTAHDMYLNARDSAEADEQSFGHCCEFRLEAEILTIMLSNIGGQLDDSHFGACR